MKNPFEKLFGEGSESIPEASDKEKKLAKLREWRVQVETGIKIDPVSQDQEQLEKIDRQIAELEAR